MTEKSKTSPWYLWPFWAIAVLVVIILENLARFMIILIGLVFVLAGVLLSLTIIGAIIGIPLAVVGLVFILYGWYKPYFSQA